ncbi:MAG: hypothetical protein IKR48_06135 [Kiritimatiellae bacterium]|nr:hypothetical protein [Kiritimatiellia bacterium]
MSDYATAIRKRLSSCFYSYLPVPYRQAPRPRLVAGTFMGITFGFDDAGVAVTQADATERVPPIRHRNLWLLTSQQGGFAALRSYRQVVGTTFFAYGYTMVVFLCIIAVLTLGFS